MFLEANLHKCRVSKTNLKHYLPPKESKAKKKNKFVSYETPGCFFCVFHPACKKVKIFVFNEIINVLTSVNETSRISTTRVRLTTKLNSYRHCAMIVVSSYFIGCTQRLLDITTWQRYPIRKFLVPSVVTGTCAVGIANGDTNGKMQSIHENVILSLIVVTLSLSTLLTMEGNDPSQLESYCYMSVTISTPKTVLVKNRITKFDMSKSFIDQLSYFTNAFELKIKIKSVTVQLSSLSGKSTFEIDEEENLQAAKTFDENLKYICFKVILEDEVKDVAAANLIPMHLII